MRYTELQPSQKFKDIVKNYWHFEVFENSRTCFPLNHETLPHTETSIVFIKQPYFQGIRIQGPHTKKFQQTIYPNSAYFGIRLMPWLIFTPSIWNKQDILNTTTSCPSILAKNLEYIKFHETAEPAKLIMQIEERLSKLFTEEIQLSQNDVIKYICLELSSGQSVGTTIAKVPLSQRVIQKIFKKVVGMSMNKYYNIHRQEALWSDLVKFKKKKFDLVYEYGFYDQAHFINDFKKQMDQSHKDFESRLRQIKISLL